MLGENLPNEGCDCIIWVMNERDADKDMREEWAGDGPPTPPPPPDDEETEFARLRRQMVDEQLAGRGIRDQRVLAAMGKVPRHRFVPREMAASAYDDHALPLPAEQTISQPYIVAIMTELAEVQAGDRVLEIGTGSGYQTAVLCEMGAEVYSIERHQLLSSRALQNLTELGYNSGNQLHLAVGDGSRGWVSAAPFDAIVVTAGAPAIPEALAEQLKEGGRLIIPVGNDRQQMLVALRREGGVLIEQSLIPCMFVPLIGEQGWPEGTGSAVSSNDEQNG